MDIVDDFRKSARVIVREFGFFRSQYEDTGASHGETHALIELNRLGRLEVGELGRLLNIDQSGASKMLTNMQKKGWVVPAAGSDGRKRIFQLTAAGRRVNAAVEKCADRKARLALDELPTAEQHSLAENMKALADALRLSRARSEYHIRPCEVRDNKAMASIVRRAIKDLGLDGPGTAAADPSLDYLSSFNTDRQFYLVAEKAGKIAGGAGILAMNGEPDTVCELVRMFLRPDARCSGLAQLLIDEVKVRARELGYKTCYLETTEPMTAAQALYRKNGFIHVKKRRGNTGHFACTVLMECSL
jgi:putative acetyltransferase